MLLSLMLAFGMPRGFVVSCVGHDREHLFVVDRKVALASYCGKRVSRVQRIRSHIKRNSVIASRQ
jgi:hypothetical protein